MISEIPCNYCHSGLQTGQMLEFVKSAVNLSIFHEGNYSHSGLLAGLMLQFVKSAVNLTNFDEEQVMLPYGKHCCNCCRASCA
jgi:hypothetical protein